MDAEVGTRLADLAGRYGLPVGAADRLATLLALVAAEPSAITTVRDPREGVDLHVADSLVALEMPQVRDATRLADLGSGGGFPGLALAIALPEVHVALVESVARKCAFLAAAAERLELANVEVVKSRAETWTPGMGVQDVITARAVAPLSVLVEYALPLLAIGGTLIAWKARPGAGEEVDACAAAAVLGMSAPERRAVAPYPAARDRYLYLSSKLSPTPAGYPRRAGMARKRPIRASSRR